MLNGFRTLSGRKNLPSAAALYTWVATGETRGRSSARVNCLHFEWDLNSLGAYLFTNFTELWIGPKSARFPPFPNALFLIKMYLLVTAANVNLMNKEIHYWQKVLMHFSVPLMTKSSLKKTGQDPYPWLAWTNSPSKHYVRSPTTALQA